MGARVSIIAITVALALTIVACPALAGESSGTETIFGMDPFSIEIDATGSDEMRVSWDIKVTDGVPVHIVLLDEENHDKFMSHLRYEAYKGHQYNYTNSSKKSVEVEEGTYFLAIESAHSSMDSSTVDYEVKWGEDSGLFDSPWCWPLAIILAILLALFGALAGRRRAGGKMTMTPRPAEASAPGTGDVTHLSPQPEPPDAPPTSDSEPPAPGTGAVGTPMEGATELGPQPEPPDMPTSDAWESTDPDPLNPNAETIHARDMPTAHMSPEPTSPGTSPPTDAPADAGLTPEPPDPGPEPSKVKLTDPDTGPDGEPL